MRPAGSIFACLLLSLCLTAAPVGALETWVENGLGDASGTNACPLATGDAVSQTKIACGSGPGRDLHAPRSQRARRVSVDIGQCRCAGEAEDRRCSVIWKVSCAQEQS